MRDAEEAARFQLCEGTARGHDKRAIRRARRAISVDEHPTDSRSPSKRHRLRHPQVGHRRQPPSQLQGGPHPGQVRLKPFLSLSSFVGAVRVENSGNGASRFSICGSCRRERARGAAQVSTSATGNGEWEGTQRRVGCTSSALHRQHSLPRDFAPTHRPSFVDLSNLHHPPLTFLGVRAGAFVHLSPHPAPLSPFSFTLLHSNSRPCYQLPSDTPRTTAPRSPPLSVLDERATTHPPLAMLLLLRGVSRRWRSAGRVRWGSSAHWAWCSG